MGKVYNKELLDAAKAIIQSSDLTTNGKLNPKQASKFIDFVVDESLLFKNMRVVKFRNEQMYIDKITVASRVAMPKTEATTTAVRRGVTTSKVTLQPAAILVPFEISDEFAKINVEGESVKEHIVRMMAAQMSNNLEQLVIDGNTVGYAVIEADILGGGSAVNYVNDSFLALKDGLLKQALSGNVVDAAGAEVSASVFGSMRSAMPSKFMKKPNDLRYFTSMEHEQAYRETTSTRATAAGDSALNSDAPLKPFGTPIIPVPLMSATPPYVETATMTGTAAQTLSYGGITDVTLLPTALAAVATAAYSSVTDYALAAGTGAVAATVTRDGGGTIGDGDVCKVTYNTLGKMLFCSYNNMILAIGRDIRLEKDRDIFAGTDQYAMTIFMDCKFEEVDATVIAKNVALPA